jgi:hypothetical protein
VAGLINIYCDESCHLENDRQTAMVLGAISIPENKLAEIKSRIADIRRRHKMSPQFEFKWTKVSPAKLGLYQDLIDYFFDDDDISFRCVVIPDKAALKHDKYDQTHDDWYYEMYFKLLKYMVNPSNKYQIYIDIKDTRSKEKVVKLQDKLCTSSLDFSRSIIQKVQQVRSHEVALVQLSDLLIGAISYKFRNLDGSAAKQEIVARIASRSRYSLTKSTLPSESKFNIFVWQAD